MSRKQMLIFSIAFIFVNGGDLFAQSVEQGKAQGKAEAESVLQGFFYKSECLSLNPTDPSSPGSSLTSTFCYKPYNDTGHYDFANFCYSYQSNMMTYACDNTNVCEQRNCTLAILRGFNEHMFSKQGDYDHVYVGNPYPSCSSICY